MKVQITLADITVNNFHLRIVSLYIKGQYMKDSNTLAGNVENNFH